MPTITITHPDSNPTGTSFEVSGDVSSNVTDPPVPVWVECRVVFDEHPAENKRKSMVLDSANSAWSLDFDSFGQGALDENEAEIVASLYYGTSLEDLTTKRINLHS
jgi:hypothetical protein